MKTKKQIIQTKYKRVHGKILGGADVTLDSKEYEVFSIHDTWVKGALIGDVDDLAAIFYLARKFKGKNVAIYIVNDIVHVEEKGSRLDQFNAAYGKALRDICPEIIFIGISGLGDFNNKLIKIGKETIDITENDDLIDIMHKSRKIIICAPIKDINDVKLCVALNTKKFKDNVLYGQSSPVEPRGYNFDITRCTLLITGDSQNALIGHNPIKWYTTDNTNRRLNKEQLTQIIGDGFIGGTNENIVDMMKKFAIMKTLFLPVLSFVLGLFVSKNELIKNIKTDETLIGTDVKGTSFGNNISGLLLFNYTDGKYDIKETLYPSNPHKLIKEYFEKNTIEGKTVDNTVDAIMEAETNKYIKTYMNDIISRFHSTTSDEVKKRFKYAMAYVAESMPKLLNIYNPIEQMYDLGTFSNSKRYNDLIVTDIDISSPMWDLVAVHNVMVGPEDPKPVDTPIITDDLFEKIINGMNNVSPSLSLTAPVLLNLPTTGEKILYYIIGPVTEKDIKRIEEYNADPAYTDIVVVLQGGIDPDTTKEWSTTLMGALPANAGMNPGQKFFQDKNKQRGWYDLLDSDKLKSLNKISVICQTTNSAKPGTNIKDENKLDSDPRNILWKKLYNNDFFNKNTQFTPIKNLIKMYDEFTAAPWQHDPIAVIHSISLLIPGFFEKDPLLEMFNTNAQYINFTQNLDGIITDSEINFAEPTDGKDIVNNFLTIMKGSGNIYVIPYKETKEVMNARGVKRIEYLFELLDQLTGITITPIESPFKKIICSLEIYDPDNLLALKCIQGLSKKLNVELEVIVHYQRYPTNIKFIKNVIDIYNYKDESVIDTDMLDKSIQNVQTFNHISDIVIPYTNGLIQTNFTGLIPAYTEILNNNNNNPLNKYISGFLMYSQLRNEFKLPNEINTFKTEETEFIKWLLDNSKVTITEGSIYGGIDGYTISVANVLHPISMFTKNNLLDDKLNISDIIYNCINTSVLNSRRIENIKSWNENHTLKEINNDNFDDTQLTRAIKPEYIFHWNILDPGTCNKGSVEKYYTTEKNDDEYYTNINKKRMNKIAEILLTKLENGNILMLQEYSNSQNEILKELILGKVDFETKEPITEMNIHNYMHYVYGSKYLIPYSNPPIFVDQGLLIASLIKFDRKDKLCIPGFKPVIYVQIGDTFYATTHYNASEGSESQSLNNDIINNQLTKLNKLNSKMYFSCDMNKSVDGTANDTTLYDSFPLIEKNVNMIQVGYKPPKVKPLPYKLDGLILIPQRNDKQLTTVPILFTIRKHLSNHIYLGIPHVFNEEIIPKVKGKVRDQDAENLILNKYTNTAPAKKIDGIYSIQPTQNTVDVLKDTNTPFFLSDHFPLTLNLIEPTLRTRIGKTIRSIPGKARKSFGNARETMRSLPGKARKTLGRARNKFYNAGQSVGKIFSRNIRRASGSEAKTRVTVEKSPKPDWTPHASNATPFKLGLSTEQMGSKMGGGLKKHNSHKSRKLNKVSI